MSGKKKVQKTSSCDERNKNKEQETGGTPPIQGSSNMAISAILP